MAIAAGPVPILDIFVRGVPAPKGSSRAFVKGNRAVVTATNPRQKDWQLLVASTLQAEWSHPPLEGPVGVYLIFQFLRPKSVSKSRLHPAVRPDVDKCARSVLDSLTGIILRDDAQVVDLRATKTYSDVSGVRISVRKLGS